MVSTIKRTFFSIVLIIQCGAAGFVYSQDQQLLSSYAADTNKGKQVTMPLRLRNFDKNFKIMTFYDKDNIDIVFDMERYEKKPLIVRSFRNFHEGMLYHVTFIITGKSPSGLLEGELVEFSPIFLDKLP